MEMSFKQFLVNEVRKYDYSSLLIELPEELTDNIISWGFDNIPNEDLFSDPEDPSFGREDDIHITVIYGIHSGNHKETQELIRDDNKIKCKLGEMILFTKNDNFDVLVIKVKSDNSHYLHKKIKNSIETTQTHAEYIPHVTIAYLKKNSGKKFVGDKTFDGETFEVNNLIFSSKTGEKRHITLKGKNE